MDSVHYQIYITIGERREVPVWERYILGFVWLQRKCLCSHRIPKWNPVFHLGPGSRTHRGEEKGSPKQREEHVHFVVVRFAG